MMENSDTQFPHSFKNRENCRWRELSWKYINPSNFNRPPFNLRKRDFQHRIEFMLFATLLLFLDDSRVYSRVDPPWLLVLINNQMNQLISYRYSNKTCSCWCLETVKDGVAKTIFILWFKFLICSCPRWDFTVNLYKS